MKKLIPFLVSSVLVAGMVGCQEAPKTDADTTSSSNETPTVPAQPASDTTEITGNPTTTPNATSAPTTDLTTEIINKLKTGIPGNKLEVENKDGEIILKGTAASKEEITQAETLIKEIAGVKTVKVEAKVNTEKKP
jgi:hyperosmotically inducible periplasmic protein